LLLIKDIAIISCGRCDKIVCKDNTFNTFFTVKSSYFFNPLASYSHNLALTDKHHRSHFFILVFCSIIVTVSQDNETFSLFHFVLSTLHYWYIDRSFTMGDLIHKAFELSWDETNLLTNDIEPNFVNFSTRFVFASVVKYRLISIQTLIHPIIGDSETGTNFCDVFLIN
jgi:hypothetical protein